MVEGTWKSEVGRAGIYLEYLHNNGLAPRTFVETKEVDKERVT